MDLFLLCVVARLALAYTALVEMYRKYVTIFLAVVAGAWVLLSLGVVRREKGVEAGGKIWWKHLRPLHACLYILAVIYLHLGHQKVASALLVADVGIGTYLRYEHRSK